MSNLIQFRDDTVRMLNFMVDVLEQPTTIKERDLRIDLLIARLHHLRYIENEQFGHRPEIERNYSSIKS